jgi:hypothetical protein
MISYQTKTQFDSVLKAQHLADVASTFSDPDFFEEVPLYSRYKQVEFLKTYGDVNLLLVELALDYLDRVTTSVPVTGNTRLVAITVISDDDDEFIVPAIFVCNSNVKTRLKELHLSSPSEGLGKRIESLVKMARPDATFSILEDRHTLPDDVRVFISYKAPPRGLVSLMTFANGANAQH